MALVPIRNIFLKYPHTKPAAGRIWNSNIRVEVVTRRAHRILDLDFVFWHQSEPAKNEEKNKT